MRSRARHWAVFATVLLPTVATALSGCSEEDRKAWVSILPIPGTAEDRESSREGMARGELAIAGDSTAVLLGADTLFTLDRLPRQGRDGRRIQPARLASALLSPDSTLVAFATAGASGTIAVWSRPRQVASVVDAFREGSVVTLTWSPGGRFLAYGGRTDTGIARAGIYDARVGSTLAHPVLDWLERSGRSVGVEGWNEGERLRLDVAPDAAPAEGLSYIWDPERATFVLESHLEPLAAEAPPGAALERGGVFSIDLVGDAVPETVALYRSRIGEPGAVLLETSVDGVFRARTTEPIVTAETLGLGGWGDAEGSPGLYLVASIGGRTTLLLTLPSPDRSLRWIGLFQIGPTGRLAPVVAETSRGERPALFLDGRTPEGASELGLLDLDGDGSVEVVSATGRLEGGPPSPAVAWRAVVFRASGNRLIPAPQLEDAALARIAEAMHGAGGSTREPSEPGP